MQILRVLTIIIIILLLVVGIETIIKIKHSENKKIEDIRKDLLLRIDIIIILTVIISVLSLLLILFR